MCAILGLCGWIDPKGSKGSVLGVRMAAGATHAGITDRTGMNVEILCPCFRILNLHGEKTPVLPNLHLVGEI